MTKEEFKEMLKESLEEMLQDGTITVELEKERGFYGGIDTIEFTIKIGDTQINRSAYL